MPSMLVNRRWAEDFPQNLLLKFSVHRGSAPNLVSLPQGRWIGFGGQFSQAVCGTRSPQHCIIYYSLSVWAREKVGWDNMPIIFENNFRDNTSNLLLAYNPLWLWSFERFGFG
jgi:hypothetical protein